MEKGWRGREADILARQVERRISRYYNEEKRAAERVLEGSGRAGFVKKITDFVGMSVHHLRVTIYKKVPSIGPGFTFEELWALWAKVRSKMTR